jgi:hypothetical protein
MKNGLVVTYIALGALYVLVKIAFVGAGYLHPGAIAHGAVPAVVTVVTGSLLLAGKSARAWLRASWAVPLLVLVITPLFMYLKKGGEWLTEGRLAVLVIYEAFALAQCVLGARMANGEEKRKREASTGIGSRESLKDCENQ